MKLAAIYRACNKEICPETFGNVRPPWFSKFVCWDTFYREFGNRLEVDIYVVFDATPEELPSELSNHIKKWDVSKEIIFVPFKDNKKSLLFTYDLIDRLLEYDGFFMSEDDHLYWPGACDVLLDAFNYSSLVCLYDSIDRYNFVGLTDITYFQELVMVGKYCHFRTAESTVMSFGFTRQLWEGISLVVRRHTNEGVGAPNDRPMFREFLRNNIRLISPIPSFSTHVSKQNLAPLRDWSTLK